MVYVSKGSDINQCNLLVSLSKADGLNDLNGGLGRGTGVLRSFLISFGDFFALREHVFFSALGNFLFWLQRMSKQCLLQKTMKCKCKHSAQLSVWGFSLGRLTVFSCYSRLGCSIMKYIVAFHLNHNLCHLYNWKSWHFAPSLTCCVHWKKFLFKLDELCQTT